MTDDKDILLLSDCCDIIFEFLFFNSKKLKINFISWFYPAHIWYISSTFPNKVCEIVPPFFKIVTFVKEIQHQHYFKLHYLQEQLKDLC